MITSIGPTDDMATAPGEAWYSVGIHPADIPALEPYAMERLRALAADPRVVAIGEAGLDDRIDVAPDVQEDIFLQQATIAEQLEKPLIIHCVGRFGRLMELHRSFKPRQRWIIHGFRRKPELARQLIAEGFDISIGLRHHPDIESVVPPERLFHETD